MIKQFPWKRGKSKKGLIKRVFLIVVLLILIFAGWIGYLALSVTYNLPDPTRFADLPKTQSTKIYDRTGDALLYEIYGEEKRTIIPYSEIPDYLKKATIAIEDKDFYSHPAYDFRSIVRAFLTNIFSGSIVQGGSTITQQLIKNAFLTPERTLSRKLKEFVLAVKIEQKYSKDDILYFYLNQIPYGENAYGVESASQTYFGKSARDLTIAECALLAAVPKAPSYYSPYGPHKEELIDRKNYVLKKMRENDYLDDYEYEKALAFEIKFLPPQKSIIAPHFVIFIKDYLQKKYGEEAIQKSGLKVITTLDVKTQKIAEETIKTGAERNTELYQGKNAAMVVEDSNTGQILAMVGSKDYFDIDNDGNFNVAVQGLRQPGSSFKPLAYLTAFQKGYTPDTIVFDLATEFDTTGDPSKSYKPVNFDEKFRGPVTLKNALAQSINIPSVKVLYLAGIKDTISTAQKMGITTLTTADRYGLSLVLGGGEVKLIDMVKAYSVFSKEGTLRDQSFILKIENSNGETLEKYEDQPREIIDSELAKNINNILSDNKARAPLFGGRLDNPLFILDHTTAAKTGTSDDYRDAWVIGYTPSYVVGIWAGNNNNKPMVKKAGSILAVAPIWQDFMSKFLADKPDEKFNPPLLKTASKAILNGQYVVDYVARDTDNNDIILPQVHSILWYVDKNNPLGAKPENPGADPQFWSWEIPVLNWLKTSGLDLSKINQPLPPSAAEKTQIININQPIESRSDFFQLIFPSNGGFINSIFEIKIKNNSAIESLNIYCNGNIIKNISNLNAGDQTITAEIPQDEFKEQNEIIIEAKNNNAVQKEELILYKTE